MRHFIAALKYKLCTQCLKHFHWPALYTFLCDKINQINLNALIPFKCSSIIIRTEEENDVSISKG